MKPIRIKILSLGTQGVGKSCLIKRYYEKRFVPKYLATIGIDYGVTRTEIDDMEVCVNIFDVSGDPIFYEVRNEFYKDTQGVILVYDVCNRKSFECLDAWLAEMKEEVGCPAAFDRTVVILCANKTDKQKRVVDEAEGRLWADLHAFPYFETSAFTGNGVQAVFQTLFVHVLRAQGHILVGKEPRSPPVPPNVQKASPRFRGDTSPPSITDVVHRLLHAKDDFAKLGLPKGANVDEINKAYRKLAMVLHPDKSITGGTEEAFKALVTVRANLLRSVAQ